jgi:MerR family copper efflux transcriptional regulator
MMISTFARESGLSVDTVRFYVRRGLLHPELGQKGGSRPYQMFSLLDVEKARIVRAGQALGLSLEEIASFLKTRTFDGAEDDNLVAFLADQRERLTRRVAELQKLISFVDAKMAWLRDPDGGASPPLPSLPFRS